jgi:sugar/nucleoside kinase (ribokinase family)
MTDRSAMIDDHTALPSSGHRVLCVGDATADIFTAPIQAVPCPGEVELTEAIAFFPGGNALNTAVALKRLGERVGFVGSVGDDWLGNLLLDQLGKIGLNLDGVRREPGGATPASIMFRVHGEDRRFIHGLGVATGFTGEHLPLELIPEQGVLMVGGYLKLQSWNDDALASMMRLARQRDCTVVLNVCIAREEKIDTSRCLHLLPDVDVFVLNEDEAGMLTGETDPAAQAYVLRHAGANRVIITRGAKGLLADDGSIVVRMGVFSVPLVDPSGCGDCFTAGLIAGLLRPWDWVRALTFASAVGALGATALGCTSGVPAFEEVEKFLSDNAATLSVSAAKRDAGTGT